MPHDLPRNSLACATAAVLAGAAWCVTVSFGQQVPPPPGAPPAPAYAGPPTALLPLKTAGNKIVNPDNQEVRLRGVNCASMEWMVAGDHILQTVNVAITDWKVNLIRLPLSQDSWFGKSDRDRQTDGGKAYRALVDEVVKLCASKNCYILLDLHWNDCDEWGVNMAQHSMPDENSIVFWSDLAPRYANNPAVLFDLYNEPHDVTWDIWQKGGQITDKPNGRNVGPARSYHAVGMQQLVNTIRITGARNLLLAGGLDWAYDFSGILNGHQLSDPGGDGIAYANHCYNNKGETAYRWVEKMEAATKVLPVIIGEFGGAAGGGGRGARGEPGNGDDWLLHVLQAIEDHKWSYTAWDLHTSAGPTLISNWNYTPTPNYGVYVKQMLSDSLPKYNIPPLPATRPATTPNIPAALPATPQ